MNIEEFEKTAKDYMHKIATAKDKLRYLEDTLKKIALTKSCRFIVYSYNDGPTKHRLSKSQQKKFAGIEPSFFAVVEWGFEWCNEDKFDYEIRITTRTQDLKFVKTITTYLEVHEEDKSIAHHIHDVSFTHKLESLDNDILLKLADGVDEFLSLFTKELELDLIKGEEDGQEDIND